MHNGGGFKYANVLLMAAFKKQNTIHMRFSSPQSRFRKPNNLERLLLRGSFAFSVALSTTRLDLISTCLLDEFVPFQAHLVWEQDHNRPPLLLTVAVWFFI